MLPAITVENLGKRYVIEHESRHDNLRDTLHHTARKLWRRVRWGTGFDREEFWALRDISFTVQPGEVLGVIGRNGAGKSTLLKILSRITEPTQGKITLRGRVASLLEVGTGFHPDLTGRENIFLNGAILGMQRAEIRRKFDEIVAFAEIERFLDTPVKRYSSGMYVRLAFAVAAHLEPEILIVDEVLAVGDIAFQKKCLGKMQDVARGQGRTVLFVSHSLEAVAAICQRGVLLNQGQIETRGEIASVVARYRGAQGIRMSYAVELDRPSIREISVDEGALHQGSLIVNIAYSTPRPLVPPVGGVVVSGTDGRPLFGSNMRMHPPKAGVSALVGVLRMELENLPLHTGVYTVSCWLGDAERDYDERRDAVEFTYASPNHYSRRPALRDIGHLDLPCRWQILES